MWPKQSEMKEFYGNPDANNDGVADAKWEATQLVRIAPPYSMSLAWDTKRRLSSIRVHHKCAESLEDVLRQIGELGSDFIRKYELDLFGGTYNFRLTRGGLILSTHSFGAAIDLSPRLNAWKKKWDGGKEMMPEKVVRIFEAAGWTWGGLWRTADAMHFQAADV